MFHVDGLRRLLFTEMGIPVTVTPDGGEAGAGVASSHVPPGPDVDVRTTAPVGVSPVAAHVVPPQAMPVK